MTQTIILAVILLLIAVGLFSIKLFFGKKSTLNQHACKSQNKSRKKISNL